MVSEGGWRDLKEGHQKLYQEAVPIMGAWGRALQGNWKTGLQLRLAFFFLCDPVPVI